MSHYALDMGIITVKVVPSLSLLVKEILPFICSTNVFTMFKPNPVPLI